MSQQEYQELILNEELIDSLGEEIEIAIEKVANQKDWGNFGLELLVVLMEMAAQCAASLQMSQEDFLEFASQFLDQSGEGMEIHSINTIVKNDGTLN